ncbi:Uncharacterized protein Adt_08834 [Abeliophyllum distichum]|uniref:Uncharacterized protein n=1 Tax=Abeliophyllum distichum TaxID=126358 RepID=A0ABD1UFI3_9LAMI
MRRVHLSITTIPLGTYTSGRRRPRARYEIDGPDQSTLDQSNGGKFDPWKALLSTNNGPNSSTCPLRRVIRVLDPTDLAFSPPKDFTPNPSIIRRHTNYPSISVFSFIEASVEF